MALLQNPFEVFPEEVWELILDQLENLQDLSNAIDAFPPLNILPNGKQFSWLIGLIMPLMISKHLHLNDIKSCRLVSKRWKNSVEICLETHTDRSTYTTGIPTEIHFNYNSCRIVTNMKTFSQSEFYNKLSHQKENLNPFPGKMVYVYVEDETNLDIPSKTNPNHHRFPHMIKLGNVRPAIQIFGDHIRHVTFNIPFLSYANDESIVKRIFQPIFHCLSFLPNLKWLQILALSLPSCTLSENSIQEISKFVQLPFRLEILDFGLWHMGTGQGNFDYDLHHYLFQYLVTHDNIKKLTIHSTFWESQFANLFPHLSEFCTRTKSLTATKQILEDLCKSPIRKVLVEVLLDKIYVVDILHVLEKYQIESLDLRGFSLSSSNRHRKLETGNMLAVRSVKVLNIKLDKSLKGFGFKFLELLPCLEYLRIEALPAVSSLKGLSQTNKDYESDYKNDMFRTRIYNLFQKSECRTESFEFIWNEFPSLQMLTVLVNKYIYQYVRESPSNVFCTANPRY